MRFALCTCLLVLAAVLVISADAKKTFSSRRKSGGSGRRGSSTGNQHKPPPQSVPHPKPDTVNTNFLNSERVGSSHSVGSSAGSTNTHYRPNPFDKKPSAPEAPKQSVPQSNGPVGFEKLNSEVQRKPVASNVPSAPVGAPPYPAAAPSYPGAAPPYPAAAPSYPGAAPSYPGAAPYPKQPGTPNGPPPAYPGYGSSNTHVGSYEPPPAYPGRPVNAPPVYSANNPSYGGYPQQSGFPQSNYPHQHGSYPGQSYSGYPNSGGNFGNYPNQGYNQGSGGYNQGFGGYNPSGGFGGYGQQGYGGNSFGGSPFGGQSYGGSPFGGNQFGGNQFGGNQFGGGGYGNPHYSPNNFGFSSNPGIFGSSPYPGYSGKYNNFGYHKKSRFGGLPIPIPIPIPIPLGGFGFGGLGGGYGRSYNHRVLDTFVKNQTVPDNSTTNVYILNNSTVTPCTTDQFIYESLNVTVLSCTAGNCTAVKVFTTTNVSGEVSVHSAGITMCLEPNTTFNSFADNVNPVVSDVHRYWMRVCKEVIGGNVTGNVTEQSAGNVSVKISETVLNETVITDTNSTTEASQNSSLPISVESTTEVSSPENVTTTPTPAAVSNITSNNSTTNSSLCETFDCSWIEMCLPSIEIVDKCADPSCPFTRTGYQPCIRIRMCKSPSTPISTFATLNTTISRIDQFNNITSVNDITNLTLVSYIPPTFPVNCSQNATDPACQPPPLSLPQEVCVTSNSTETVASGEGTTTSQNNGTSCVPPGTPNLAENASSTTQANTTSIPS